MTKSRAATQEHQVPSLLTVEKEYFKKELEKRIIVGEEIYARLIQTEEQLNNSYDDYSAWNDYNSELLKQSFNHPKNEYKISYDRVNEVMFYGGPQTMAEKLQEHKDDIKAKVGNLKNLVEKIPLLKSDLPQHSNSTQTNSKIGEQTKNIFIVHGHNNEIKVTVARTLEQLGLNPIILHEQANAGKTIIEKFEEHSDVGYAVVLMTDDDMGRDKKDENLNYRTRQNVILELGYFIGKLGRKKVCPLYMNGVELPSDLYGLLYTELDASESWKFKLAKELKAAGYDVNLNSLL